MYFRILDYFKAGIDCIRHKESNNFFLSVQNKVVTVTFTTYTEANLIRN